MGNNIYIQDNSNKIDTYIITTVTVKVKGQNFKI